MKTCCFTGHRPKSLPCGYNEEHPACLMIKKQLRRLIVGVIEKKNVTKFISGMALGTDMWALEIVLDLKDEYPNITLEAAVPCRNQASSWNVKYKERYNKLLSLCDEVTVLQEEYIYDCMMKRNKYMVQKADYVIAVWNGTPSGTDKTIQYALDMCKPVYYVDVNDFRMKAI
ncbi:MAG: DUF1273 family protein [Oscillospiraceae bacterium]|nr:DUF1273 family protein [Oscillospiraceae bacterium]